MKRYILLTLIVISFVQCKTENITPDVKFLDATFFGQCFLMPAEQEKEVVIRSQKEYEAYFDGKRLNAFNLDCSQATTTPIDFDKHSLIGTKTSGACSAEYKREIDRKGKNITYSIDVSYSGFCEMLVTNMNWALVPKIKKRAEVVFEVNEVHQN
jgi:hypothetical protein